MRTGFWRSLILFCLALASSTACVRAQTLETMDETRPVPIAEPESIAIGVVISQPALRMKLPEGVAATNAAGVRYVMTQYDLTLTADSTGVRWWFENGSPGPVSSSWRIEPMGGDFLILNDRRYRGAMRVFVSPETGLAAPALTAANILDLENYIRGVVAREIGFVRQENYEAIKAQAVAARTYAVRNQGRRRALGFDLFGTSMDQVYGGADAETLITDSAVAATRGQILAFQNEVIDAFYHSTCGGKTAGIFDVWKGSQPYLCGVDDALGETFACVASRYFRWTEVYRGETLARFSAPGTAITVDVLEKDWSGRNRRIRILRGESETIVSGDAIRQAIRRPDGSPLRSTRFDFHAETGLVRIDGGGWGHGIGMCQTGALGRARAGKTYAEILLHYYPGAAIVTLRIPYSSQVPRDAGVRYASVGR
jgi:stage II sporulation protein D